jgi:hypothetical protein
LAEVKLESDVALTIIARSLAYIALKAADLDGKTIQEQAKFLEGLGVDRKDVAEMLGTSADSIGVMLRRAKGKKGKKARKKR